MITAIAFLAEDGGQIQEIARTFGVDWLHLGAQVISFLAVCLVLHKFAYRKALTALNDRRDRIAEGLDNAEKIKSELAETKTQRQALLAEASAQATGLIHEAHAAAGRVREEETQRALAAAQQIMEKAREEAARDHDRMLTELKREVGRLVVEVTAAVTGKVLTEEDQRSLAAEAAQAVDGRGTDAEAEQRRRAAAESAGELMRGNQLGVTLDEKHEGHPTNR
jgi:F-type H+-transporting ATPase subunit b